VLTQRCATVRRPNIVKRRDRVRAFNSQGVIA
jgi:hypothetical protein